MKAVGGVILALLLLSGCSTIRNYQAADAYNTQTASNASEYGNGQIPLSEKLRRDHIAGIQYGQINEIEAFCIERYMYLAKHYEQGIMTEARFNDWRDTLEMACSQSYSTGDLTPAKSWQNSYTLFLAWRG